MAGGVLDKPFSFGKSDVVSVIRFDDLKLANGSSCEGMRRPKHSFMKERAIDKSLSSLVNLSQIPRDMIHWLRRVGE